MRRIEIGFPLVVIHPDVKIYIAVTVAAEPLADRKASAVKAYVFFHVWGKSRRSEKIGNERTALHRQSVDRRDPPDERKRAVAPDGNVRRDDRRRVYVRYGEPVFADQLYRGRPRISTQESRRHFGSHQDRVLEDQRPAVVNKIIVFPLRGFGITDSGSGVDLIVCIQLNVLIIDFQGASFPIDDGDRRGRFLGGYGRFCRRYGRFCRRYRRFCRRHGCFRFRIVGKRRGAEARQRKAGTEYRGKKSTLHRLVPPCRFFCFHYA